jgi:hypothetical protein
MPDRQWHEDGGVSPAATCGEAGASHPPDVLHRRMKSTAHKLSLRRGTRFLAIDPTGKSKKRTLEPIGGYGDQFPLPA